MHDVFKVLPRYSLVENGFPVALIGLFQYCSHWPLNPFHHHSFAEKLVKGSEVFFDQLHQLWEAIFKKVDYTVHVQLRAEQIEEGVLAVALIELSYLILEFQQHWEAGAGVRHARHHLSNAALKLQNLLRKFLVLLLELVPFLASILELASDDFEFVLGVS